MKEEFSFICKEIWKGKSILRAYLNLHLKDERIAGKTIDIGGGAGANYIAFMKRESDVSFETFDLKSGNYVDFEKDTLPAEDGQYDTVLFLNVLEHIFNHQHIANEVVRITKPEGRLVGYVPFLMWYHPDHKDFFRYTHEALEIIFTRAGAKDVKITPIAPGPFTAGLQMVLLILPRIIRPLVFLPVFFLDKVYSNLKKESNKRYVLGYMFVCSK